MLLRCVEAGTNNGLSYFMPMIYYSRIHTLCFLLLICFPGKPKQKVVGKAMKMPSLTLTEVLPPPPPLGELQHYEQEQQPPEHKDMDLGWARPCASFDE